jgi:hypothetical protein
MNNHKRKRAGLPDMEPWVTRITSLTYTRLALLYAGLIVGFGVLYFLLSTFVPGHGPSIPLGAKSWLRFLDALYFSTITATSVGYGDISPHGISKILAGFQSISSLFVFAILVSKPISHRQEAALYQMHQLTFDDVFTSVREGFFIMRKDFDELISEAHQTKKLQENLWENLLTAYRQGEVLFEEIPKFYDTERRLYVIDTHREQLLIESVERTLERLWTLLRTFDAVGIRWREDAKHTERFDELLAIAKQTAAHWQAKSPHRAKEEFSELETVLSEIISLREKK